MAKPGKFVTATGKVQLTDMSRYAGRQARIRRSANRFYEATKRSTFFGQPVNVNTVDVSKLDDAMEAMVKRKGHFFDGLKIGSYMYQGAKNAIKGGGKNPKEVLLGMRKAGAEADDFSRAVINGLGRPKGSRIY